MVEGLVIASGAAKVVSLGIQVTTGLVKYYNSWKSQNAKVSQLLKNLDFLQKTFQHLQKALRGRLKETKQIEESILDCNEFIKELRDELSRFDKSLAKNWKQKVETSGRRAAYPFKQGTLQNLEDSIAEIRDSLSLAISILNLGEQKIIQDDIRDVSVLVRQMSASHISSIIRRWLDAPDATLDHNIISRKHQPGTGEWFINGHIFQNWLKEPNLLWISGFAGSGKSVLCSTAIQHALRLKSRDPEIGVAFFYLKFTDDSKQDVSAVLRAFFLQLSVQLPGAEQDLQRLYSSYGTGTPPKEVLQAYMQRIVQRFNKVFIFLDALDESLRFEGRSDVLSTIKTMQNWSKLHLLVTSQDLVDIRDALISPATHEVQMNNSGVDEDIARFVSSRLEASKELKRFQGDHYRIQQALTSRAQGVFRYVECQFNQLEKSRNRIHIDNCLNSLPEDLSETYDRILSSIDKTWVDDVRRILTTICFSKKPMTVAEVRHAHAVDINDEPEYLNLESRILDVNSIQEMCTGLIVMVQFDHSTAPTDDGLFVLLAHSTVQEYLRSDNPRRGKAQTFIMEANIAHDEISRVCLIYLLNPGIDWSSIGDLPFSAYAARFWTYHYIHSLSGTSREASPQLETLILKLFNQQTPAFQIWREFDGVNGIPTFSLLPNNVNFEDDPSEIVPRNRMERESDPMERAAIAAIWGLSSVFNEILTHTLTALQQMDAFLDFKGAIYDNALCITAYKGHEHMIKALIKNGANVNSVYNGRRGSQKAWHGTPLQAASAAGREDITLLLLQNGAEINKLGGPYGSALQRASFFGRETVVRMLLDKGADVNIISVEAPNVTSMADNWDGDTALALASLRGHISIVKVLLDHDADINIRCQILGTTLHAAAAGGKEEIVEALLNKHADATTRGGRRDNVLLNAVFDRDNVRLVQLLLNYGAGIHINTEIVAGKCSSHYPLERVARRGNADMIQLLLDKGAHVDGLEGFYTGKKHASPLYLAAVGGHVQAVKLLLHSGADMSSLCSEDGSLNHAMLREGLSWLIRKERIEEVIKFLEAEFSKNSDR
ncbi:hypothetical protein N7513_013112 [Penicillium frequentans]|nr:hypothetical protein N7513_013112 [Penicillium glabrum]